MPLENVSDTALWVAIYRAMETERPDAIFRDPYARRLAGERGEEIVRSIHRAHSVAWAMIVRTAVFDEMILDAVQREKVDLVLNLAAGLDARPWRLRLPATLRWVDVDLPGILQYKTDAMREVRPACRYEAIHADLTDAEARRALVQRLGAEFTRAIVVTEGLLVYLSPEQVGELAHDLSAPASFRWWIIDLASPRLMKIMQRWWGKSAQGANAPFKFAPAEGTAFFRPFGWREGSYRSSGEEARRLRREMRGMWFWRLISHLYPKKLQEEFRRMSGIVLLDRAAPPA
jgi:methyltransferase (TIGR00027 family)